MGDDVIVIFTDLDGTLLDENYSFDEARVVIEEIKRRGIPLIFCSAKTRAEQEYFQKMMGISDPFIVEDGSAIFFQRGYFKRSFEEFRGNYQRVILGVKREEILKEIESIQRRGMKVRGFFNMSMEEVSKITGLSYEMSIMAMNREFSEIIVEADEGALRELKRKFNVVLGGRFLHVYGKSADKGKAVRILTEFFREERGDVLTVGIGNSYTDEPLLRNVDIPILVRNRDGFAEIDIENLIFADEIGPRGFSRAIREILSKLGNGKDLK